MEVDPQSQILQFKWLFKLSGLALMRIFPKFPIKTVFRTASIVIAGSMLVPSAQAMSPKATELTNIGGIPITNSMVTSWVLSALIILLIRYLVKKPQLIPTKGQYIVETLVEGIRGLIEPIVGKKLVKPTFPLLIGFFTFILLQNWSGLFPGVGTIGYLGNCPLRGMALLCSSIRGPQGFAL
jgi:F-type H+-transporting ATPase subunit a